MEQWLLAVMVVVIAPCAPWKLSNGHSFYCWTKQLADAGTWPVIGGLLVGVDRGVLVIADQSSVFGVSLAALREIWRTAAEQQYNPPHFEGMVDGVVLTRLYLDNQPVLTARSIAEGTVLWEMPVSSDSYTVLGGGESVLLTRRKDGGDEEELVAVDPRTGAELWQSDLTGFSGSIYWMETVVQGRVVYVYLNAAPGRIAALNADSGAVLWSVETPFGIRRARLFGGLIYCVGVDDERLHPQLHALDGRVAGGLGRVAGSDLLLVSPPNDLLLVTSSRKAHLRVMPWSLRCRQDEPGVPEVAITLQDALGFDRPAEARRRIRRFAYRAAGL